MTFQDRHSQAGHWRQAFHEIEQYLKTAPANISRRIVLEQLAAIQHKATETDKYLDLTRCPRCSMNDMRNIKELPYVIACGTCNWWRDCEAGMDHVETHTGYGQMNELLRQKNDIH